MGVQEKEQLWFFLYWLQTFGRLITAGLSCQKDPGNMFLVKLYGRVNTI